MGEWPTDAHNQRRGERALIGVQNEDMECPVHFSSLVASLPPTTTFIRGEVNKFKSMAVFLTWILLSIFFLLSWVLFFALVLCLCASIYSWLVTSRAVFSEFDFTLPCVVG